MVLCPSCSDIVDDSEILRDSPWPIPEPRYTCSPGVTPPRDTPTYKRDMASRRGIVLVLVSAASLASIAAPPPLITSGRLVLKTASQSFAGRGLVVRTPRVLDNRRERR
eukprot:1374148-Amorphochlora_amoeboformis.AAC.1